MCVSPQQRFCARLHSRLPRLFYAFVTHKPHSSQKFFTSSCTSFALFRLYAFCASSFTPLFTLLLDVVQTFITFEPFLRLRYVLIYALVTFPPTSLSDILYVFVYEFPSLPHLRLLYVLIDAFVNAPPRRKLCYSPSNPSFSQSYFANFPSSTSSSLRPNLRLRYEPSKPPCNSHVVYDFPPLHLRLLYVLIYAFVSLLLPFIHVHPALRKTHETKHSSWHGTRSEIRGLSILILGYGEGRVGN